MPDPSCENCGGTGKEEYFAEPAVTRERYCRCMSESEIADAQIAEWVDKVEALVAALKNARRSMIVSVTGVTDGLTIHDIRRWIEAADAALAKAEK